MVNRRKSFPYMLLLSIFLLLTAQTLSGETGTIGPSQGTAGQGDHDATGEDELLQALSSNGTEPAEMILETGETKVSVLLSMKGSTFDLSWYSFSSGGSPTEEGEFTLVATIGQPVAGEASGGEFSVRTGFGTGSQNLAIFSDGFDTGDLSAWSNSTNN